jgi:hypothetical protein
VIIPGTHAINERSSKSPQDEFIDRITFRALTLLTPTQMSLTLT